MGITYIFLALCGFTMISVTTSARSSETHPFVKAANMMVDVIHDFYNEDEARELLATAKQKFSPLMQTLAERFMELQNPNRSVLRKATNNAPFRSSVIDFLKKKTSGRLRKGLRRKTVVKRQVSSHTPEDINKWAKNFLSNLEPKEIEAYIKSIATRSESTPNRAKREPRGDIDAIDNEKFYITNDMERIIQNDELYDKFYQCYNDNSRVKRRGDIDPLQDRRDFVERMADEVVNNPADYERYSNCLTEADGPLKRSKREPRGDIDVIENEKSNIKNDMERIINNGKLYDKFYDCYNEMSPLKGLADPLPYRRKFVEKMADEAVNNGVAYQRFSNCLSDLGRKSDAKNVECKI